MKQLRLALIFFLAIAGAGCEDRFRYNCQDPANWNKVHCNPPTCEANGTCTKYLIKGEPNEN
jgi:hypothetical protein